MKEDDLKEWDSYRAKELALAPHKQALMRACFDIDTGLANRNRLMVVTGVAILQAYQSYFGESWQSLALFLGDLETEANEAMFEINL